MKKLILMAVVSIAFWSCKTSQPAANTNASRIESDSTQYEITIIDPDFDMWYLMNFVPSRDYTDQYYHQWNLRAVGNWNSYVTRGRYRRAINEMIYYNPGIDYGIEVNRKLYWYFKFIEEKYRVPLLN